MDKSDKGRLLLAYTEEGHFPIFSRIHRRIKEIALSILEYWKHIVLKGMGDLCSDLDSQEKLLALE